MNDWTSRFPGLAELDQDGREFLEQHGRLLRFSRGHRVYSPGETPDNYVLLLEGDIRVSQISENGREIVLYRVNAGESCALTTTCLMSGQDYMAEAVAETDIEIVAIARSSFEEVIGRSATFRRFVLSSFGQRITDLCKLVDEIAFQKMDVRLAHKLLELAGTSEDLQATHQQLAIELGTAREVVSRQLQELQRRGLIRSSRGSTRILDRKGLQQLAGEF